MVAARKRITISLNLDVAADKAVLDFLSGLPKRTRSDVIKEILHDALRNDKPPEDSSGPSVERPQAHEGDAEKVIDSLFL